MFWSQTNLLRKWRDIRKHGLAGFIFRYGVLRFGVTAGVIFAAIRTVLFPGLRFAEDRALEIALIAGLFLFLGCIWAAATWWSCERKFRQHATEGSADA